MKLLWVNQSHRVEIAPVRGRLVELVSRVDKTFVCDDGAHKLTILPGFLYNQRSGPPELDRIIPYSGTQEEASVWLSHDAGGYPDTWSAECANQMLRQELILICGYSESLANAAYKVCSATSKFWKSDSWEETDKQWLCNKGKIIYTWSPK